MQWYIDVFFHRQSFWSILHEDQNNQVGEEDGLTTVAGYEHKKEDGKLIAVVSLGQIMTPSVLETFSLLCLQTSRSSGFANLNFWIAFSPNPCQWYWCPILAGKHNNASFCDQNVGGGIENQAL